MDGLHVHATSISVKNKQFTWDGGYGHANALRGGQCDGGRHGGGQCSGGQCGGGQCGGDGQQA